MSTKVKRLKRASRILTFYKYSYKVEAPYRVLVDGTFCMAAMQHKINLREQMPKYLQGVADIVTTKCILNELELLGPAVHGAQAICRQYEVDTCPHQPCRTPAECLVHLARRAGNGKTKYIFATQDSELTSTLRTVVGTPILYIKHNTILLDNISETTKNASDMSRSDIERVKELKKKLLGEEPVKKKKRKMKGKNPLSCKKKIVKASPLPLLGNSAAKTANGKRRRKKKTPSSDSVAKNLPAQA